MEGQVQSGKLHIWQDWISIETYLCPGKGFVSQVIVDHPLVFILQWTSYESHQEKCYKLSNCPAEIQSVSFKYLERCFQWSLWRAEGPSPLTLSPHGLLPAVCNRSQTCSSDAVGCPNIWTGRSPWQPAEYTAPRTPPYCREKWDRVCSAAPCSFHFLFISALVRWCVTYLWEVIMMALPDSLVRVIASQSSRLATGSMPVDGSSRKITGGPPIRAMPALNFLLLPPLCRGANRQLGIQHIANKWFYFRVFLLHPFLYTSISNTHSIYPFYPSSNHQTIIFTIIYISNLTTDHI